MTEGLFSLTRDLQLAPYATSAVAAWFWSSGGDRVLWANASAAALSGAASPRELIGKPFADHELGVQVARIAATLPAFGETAPAELTAAHGALACTASRIGIDGTVGILIVANAPVQPVLPLAARVERMFGALSATFAVYSGMGTLLVASPSIAEKLGSATTLAALGAGALMAEAIASGHAAGKSNIGDLTVDRLGAGGATVLLAVPERAKTPESVPNIPENIPEPYEISPPPADDVPDPAPATLADIEAALLATPAPPEPTPAAAGTLPDQPAHPPAPEAPPETPATPAEPERRHPLRFVWTMDAEEHFTLTSREFAEIAGERTAALMGRPWHEIAAALGLDPDGRVAHAVATRDTWSGITIAWPVEGSHEHVSVELSGLPIFDRDRTFRGYRGFGVCRNVARVPHPPQSGARPVLTVVPSAENVVPFRAAPAPDKRTALTPVEHSAFREIAETLGATPAQEAPREPAEPRRSLPSAFAVGDEPEPQRSPGEAEMRTVLDRLPVGILIHHGDHLIYANHALLEWTGYATLAALAEDGGLERLAVEPDQTLDLQTGTGKAFNIATRASETLACEGRLYTVQWDGEPVLMLVLVRSAAGDRMKASTEALRAAETELREMRAVLDTAADGVVVMDRDGRVLSLNRAAEALFGYGYHDIARRPFVELLAQDSERAAREYLDLIAAGNVTRVHHDGREVIGRTRAGTPVPLFMTMGRVGDSGKLCAVFRDVTAWKRAEEELVGARRNAERASSAKSDFLAKISHEIRTPLNAILGFSEVMMEERFGAIGNERYREYVKDIHTSGGHLVSLINDLLDLSKIEAGKLDLVFANVNLNSLVQQCITLMQPQANRERIIIRSALSASLPTLMADARSVRQIVLNLLSNSIKFTGAGGQVIVSTAATERGEIALRVRDTGAGMTEKEIETAMEPFRQLATSSRWGSAGTGLGLPLTKALAEANHARFVIESQKDAGTLVEIVFPGARAAAE
jgi:PAS domain S-box-containing protein